MKNKSFPIFLLLFGEALVIIASLHFERALPGAILALNIFVTSVIYMLYAANLILPVFDLKDRSQKTIGAIGIKSFFYILYTVIAAGLMIGFNNQAPYTNFNTQLIVHLIGFFVLFAGLYFANLGSEKTLEVYEQQTNNRGVLDAVKSKAQELKGRIGVLENAPADIRAKLTACLDNIRYISPNSQQEALAIEKHFLDNLQQLDSNMSAMPPDYEKIGLVIKNCETLYQQRQQMYTIA